MNKTTLLTRYLAKISLILGLIAFFISCNAVKRVPEGKFLLTENIIQVDGEEVTDLGVNSQLYQRPNPVIPILGVPIGLHIYNLAKPNPDSTFRAWLQKKPNREQRLIDLLSKKQLNALDSGYVDFNEWLKRTGDAPVIIDEERAQKSANRLKRYYFSYGYFNAAIDYTIDPSEKKKKRAAAIYSVQRNEPYVIDSISEKISSPVVDSLFQQTKESTFIKSGNQYNSNDFINERDRLSVYLRNSGLYHFDQEYIAFDADTVNTNHKANITYLIPNRKVTAGDSVYTVPFKVHTVNEVRIVTDYNYASKDQELSDSASFKGYKIFSYDKLKYKPKAITDAISITPNNIFKDIDRTLTYSQISDLKIFKYPNISYQEDPQDTTGTGLIATILLTPRKKATLDFNFDAYTSTIQQFGVGFSGSLILRNIFRGAEILQISGRGSVGSSKDAADSNSRFFNISEVGGDVKLTFPRIVAPFNTNKLIPKYMSPSTSLSLGFGAQNNIGLDRQTINGIFNYRWKPSNLRTNLFDLLNIQYVRNLNTNNYFNVYRNSFDQLNDIAGDIENSNPGAINPMLYVRNSNNELRLIVPEGANTFISNVLDNTIEEIPGSSDEFSTIRNINERKQRLTEDNLIFASSFSWIKDSRENIFDLNFSRLRWKVEAAGNTLAGIASLAGLETNEDGNYKALGVVFSQYTKVEADYIKHWEFKNKAVLAARAFAGIAIPYGNSKSIPFTRSYFAGGANDNRGWRPYDLGPGSSGGINEFNEANFKIALNGEYRFTILGAFKGALFVDAGNIWNALDNEEDPASRFDGIQDLKEIAVATGLGLRYDFAFAVLRLDLGFKTHNPARPVGDRWFKDYNFSSVVYNIGINYPF